MATDSFSLDQLNPEQRRAVEILDRPVLVLAGAGSGKTRVLTHKIAHIISKGDIRPWEILAVTFTNKAASEMQRRVEGLLNFPVEGMWMGTFHSICARLLRIEAHQLGISSNYTIYDVDDQQRLIKKIMDQQGIDPKVLPARKIQYTISDSKNKMINARRYAERAGNFAERKIAEVFEAYQQELKLNNAMDFDELLLGALDVLTRSPETLQKYQHKFRYILVDEYQDTNKAQYYLIKQLSAAHQNICVVGDEDQSIYRWRGADIENILSFEKDFSNFEVVRLEQNYRSTQNILDAANSVVANNSRRLGKNLWSQKSRGNQITVKQEIDETGEASAISAIINHLINNQGLGHNDIAILYRTNAQSRAIEERLRRVAIPYVLVGGTRFYERKEIKDILAYLRILVNPDDGIALRRIINFPARGIGAVSLQKMDEFAESQSISLYQALKQYHLIPGISSRLKTKLKSFIEAVEELAAYTSDHTAYETVLEVISIFGLRKLYEATGLPEDETRLENINELVNSVAVFVENQAREEQSLAKYLEGVALLTDVDRWDPSQSAVTMMTLHSAKGLEFPAVIVTGMEQGLFPLFRSLENSDDLEEERRLFYVGMTRAEEHLYLLWASQRRRFTGDGSGMSYRNMPSQFLGEIPATYKEESRVDAFQGARRPRPARERKNSFEAAAAMIDSGGKYKIGQKVRHEMFGNGQILGMEGSGMGLKLSIVFGRTVKKLIAEYANLEIIE